MKRQSDLAHTTAPLGMETISSLTWKGQHYPHLALNKCLAVGWIGIGETG